jgi:hypothetical protein
MDTKERFLIDQSLSKILSGSFTELDVLALLIILRNHSDQHNLVREFGDFVAHREKDRGILKNYRDTVQLAFNSNSTTINEPITIKVFTSSNIRDAFNEVLRSIGKSDLDIELANQITVCIISLLQSVQVKGKLDASIPQLKVGLTFEYIALLGQAKLPAGHIMAFPILVAQNKYKELPSSISEYMILDHTIEAYSLNGDFRFAQRAPLA